MGQGVAPGPQVQPHIPGRTPFRMLHRREHPRGAPEASVGGRRGLSRGKESGEEQGQGAHHAPVASAGSGINIGAGKVSIRNILASVRSMFYTRRMSETGE